jgi:hypothetical protein
MDYALPKHIEHDSKGLHQQVSVSVQMSHSHAALSCTAMASFCHWSHTASNSARACGSASKTSSNSIRSLITENSIPQNQRLSTNNVTFLIYLKPLFAVGFLVVARVVGLHFGLGHILHLDARSVPRAVRIMVGLAAPAVVTVSGSPIIGAAVLRVVFIYFCPHNKITNRSIHRNPRRCRNQHSRARPRPLPRPSGNRPTAHPWHHR